MSVQNRTYLEATMELLRLLLQRRSLWLRSLWQRDAEEELPGIAITDREADLALSGALSLRREWEFYRKDPYAAALDEKIDEARTEAGRIRQGDESGEIRLSVLSGIFGLVPFEELALISCLAPELDPSFSTLYGYVQDDAQRRFPTPQLIVALFADESTEYACRARLARWSTLARYRLMRIEESATPGQPWSAQPLRLPQRIAQFLVGGDSCEERLQAVWQTPVETTSMSWIEGLAEQAAAGMQAAQDECVNLTGKPESGKELVAASLCRQRGLSMMILDAARLPTAEADRHDVYRLLDRESKLAKIAYYVAAPEVDSPERSLAHLFSEMIEKLESPLIIDSLERWPMKRSVKVIPLPRPDRAAQMRIWKESLGELSHISDDQIDRLVQQFDFGPETIHRAVEEAQEEALAKGRAPIAGDGLWQVCRRQAGWRLDDLAQRIIPQFTEDDIVLGEDQKLQLKEIAAQVENRSTVYERWGFGARLSRGRGITALFSGPSGTGKTMAAEILANRLKLDLYVIDLAGMVSKYIGETEKNLRRVFDAAEQCGAILFFDEADALFGKRSEVKDSHDRYANIEVNYLLQKMEQYQGLAILSTNRKSALDRAFLRRLRFLVDFPFPDRESREEIWRKHFPQDAPLDGIDFHFLSRLEIAGGNIRNIALNAAFLAAGQRRHILPEHVMRAARQEYSKIDKLVTEAEFGPYYRRDS